MIYAWTNASGVGVGVRCDDDEHLHPFLSYRRKRQGPNHDIVVQYEGLLTYHQYYQCQTGELTSRREKEAVGNKLELETIPTHFPGSWPLADRSVS